MNDPTMPCQSYFTAIAIDVCLHRAQQEAFNKVMDGIGQSIPIINNQLFDSFDLDKNGTIDFREFAVGMCHMKNESLDEKMKMIFHVYDVEGQGEIQADCLKEVLKAIISRASPGTEPENIEVMVLDMIRMSSIDENGLTNFEQFRKAAKRCLHDVGGVALFSSSNPAGPARV